VLSGSGLRRDWLVCSSEPGPSTGPCELCDVTGPPKVGGPQISSPSANKVDNPPADLPKSKIEREFDGRLVDRQFMLR
jgi:hypothetical protein